MLTEQRNPQTTRLDVLSTDDLLTSMNDEDAKVALAVRAALPQIAQAVDGIVERMRQGGRLFYVGAGTSGRLGVLDASECVPTFGTSPDLVQGLIAGGEPALTTSVEAAEDDAQAARLTLQGTALNISDTVVGVAASGRTPYTLGAIQFGNEIGALTVGLACNMPSPLVDQAQIGIGVLVGPEVLTGSTRLKAGTAQKMVLNMLSTATMVQLGKVYGNLMVDVQLTNAKLIQRARSIIAEIADVEVEQAGQLLEQAGGEVKTAIVLAVRQTSPDAARQMLAEANGILRQVIG